MDFDELGIHDVVDLLRHAPMYDILRSFNSERPGEDPVIHFYEDFLKAYDKKMRAKRGVFYTPRPVVQFIVRSVHEILQTEFSIEDGLASTITWREMRKRKPELALPVHTTDDMHFVQILDPGAVNRVILASDGDFNVGTTDTAGLIDLIGKKRASGVYLTTLGVGDGNLPGGNH